MGKDLKGNPLPPGIMQRKSGIYRGRFYYKGETYTKDNADLKKLVQEMEDLRYEVKHGLKGKGDNITLDTWFDIWLNTHKKRTIKESTQVRYDDFYRRYIKKQIGKQRVADFNPIILERLLQNMADDDYSTKTIRDVYNILNAMFKYAVHNRILTFNPCAGVEVPKTKTKQIRVLTVKEQREVLEHAKERIHENLIQVALGTGMRGGELLGLTWDDVDFRKREISVNKTLVYIKDKETKKYVFKYQTPKTKNSIRTIPMQDSVYKALKRQWIQLKEMQLSASEWQPLEGFENLVFVGKNGKPITEHTFQVTLDWIEKSINKERKKQAEKNKTVFIPIPHFYPHALRHTFATRCFEAGIDAKVVQGFLGHYSIAITLDLYTHVTEATLLSAMENPTAYMESHDKAMAKTLGETGGLGTVATRADIIEKLFKSFLLEKRGKDIYLTSKAKQLLELVPEELKQPELTADWEMRLSQIAKGKLSRKDFMKDIDKYTDQVVSEIKTGAGTFRHDNLTNSKCPRCGKRMLAVKGKNSEMLVCQDRECGYRETVSRTTNARCPVCHKKMQLKGRGDGQIFVCVCGHKEKLTSFQERRKKEGAGVSKKDVQKYLRQQKDEPVNNPFADALAKIKL